MSPDLAVHWWFLLLALFSVLGPAIGRMTDGIPTAFRIIVIGGMIAGIIFHRWTRFRKRMKR